MAVTLSFIGGAGWQFFTDDGVPLSGGKIYTYAAGTTTPLTTYTSRDGLTPNTNPIILDAAGRTPQQIWATEGLLYKYVVKTSDDTLIRTWDNIGGSVVASDLGQELANTTDNTKGDALVGFRQSDASGFLAGTVGRTVNSKLQEFVSIRDFGAAGDGVNDDTAAVQAALNSEKALDWGGLTYRITSTISRTYTTDVFWEGRGATIVYAGAHAERAVLLQGAGITIALNDLTVNGAKLCNKCLEINNDTDSYSDLICNSVLVTGAKRINSFSGGDGLAVRGAFNTVTMNSGGAYDCELPTGQGTPGTIGICGISVNWYSATRYTRTVNINGIRVEKIYSSDLAYTYDQDGVQYFAPTSGTRKLATLLTCTASDFVNCYGRSIKTQCSNTVVQACSFTRSEGFSTGIGNGEIDAQNGNGCFRDNMFSYTNGQQPGVCMSVSGLLGSPGLLVDGCTVTLGTATSLRDFTGVFPAGGGFSRHIITNNKVYGTVERFFSFLCNGDKNYAEISNNYVADISLGVTSQKALVYVEASGAVTPYRAYPTIFGNVYGGVDTPAVALDSIPGTGANAVVSAWSNYGFADDLSVSTQASGAKLNPVARIGRITGTQGEGAYFEVISQNVASNATAVFNLRNDTGCLVFIQAQFGQTGYALIGSSGSANVVIAKGSPFEIGNTSEPGTGTFRVWSSGTRQISIKNTDANARVVSVFVLSP